MLLISRKRGADDSLLEDDVDFPAIDHGCSKISFSSSKRRKLSAVHLSEDMLYEILLRLPVKSLIRFRCVSKGVCGMIDSPVFVKKRNHQCEGSLSDYAVIVCDHTWFSSLKFSDDLKRANPIKLDRFSSLGMGFLGWCNGIFCLWELRKEETYILWNPSNGTTKKVRCPNLPPRCPYTTAVSIGYDYVNDDYKLTRSGFTFNEDEEIYYPTSLQVYSLRKDSWKSFDGKFPPGYPSPFEMQPYYALVAYPRTGICVSNAMHWLWENPIDSSRFIVVFDLVTESFRSLPLPEKPRGLGMEPIDLTDFGGCLCVTFCPLDHVVAPTVWVMENYGCERSWTPLHAYNGKRKGKVLEYSYFPNKERRLLCNKRMLTWWNPYMHSFNKIQVKGHPKVYAYYGQFSYIRNLVRLDKKLI